eukprot:659381-Alexandrium_andersonii.AAC.1
MAATPTRRQGPPPDEGQPPPADHQQPPPAHRRRPLDDGGVLATGRGRARAAHHGRAGIRPPPGE